MKLLIFAFCAFITTKNVHCLECYATEIKNLTKGGQRLTPVLENCEHNIKKLLEIHGKSATELPAELDFSCYKVVVSANEEEHDVEVKGCIPKDGCGIIKSVFEFMFKTAHVRTYDVHCYECQKSRCNSAGKNQIFSTLALILAFVASVI